ncbi:Rieske 2Fe-2S domain-containing protein [Frankia sp. AgB1.9]|uniref:aromatic ring-hydroxylating oxygenase subunit alpha n=1 Tax=unclassified Frankia TaxID=2632575 RepID=UPI0035A82CC5|nr:Rieske 2Fe-2S domain-containing protein [Frankia sp. AgW1.1]MBL7549390.1 Rieske 2Fe-2S domain-containing protein [Frankia sp. AgB1.9]
MDRNELIDITRRALKISMDKTTDMMPSERVVPATIYTSQELFEREREYVRRAPQLVGYRSELPEPGSYTTKQVMDVAVLLTRDDDGAVRAFQNVCAHRQAKVAEGCGVAERFTCPYHAWSYNKVGALVSAPGRDGFPTAMKGAGLTELPAAEHAGFLWVGLDPDGGPLDIASHLGDLGPELASWGIGDWNSVGEKVLDAPANWKLALDTFGENYHFASVHQNTFALLARSNCALFDTYGPHHRLIFPLQNITELADKPESEWEPLHNFVVIYAIFPNIVMSVTFINGEIFRVYPGEKAGHSITVHQNATTLDVSDEAGRKGADDIFEYAHSSVRDEDYPLAAKVQANMESGARPNLTFGRNEPGLHHRHACMEEALGAVAAR